MYIELGKNVAFFIGDNNISLISYQNEYKFRTNCKREYKQHWNEDNLRKIVVSTFWKDAVMLSKIIPDINVLDCLGSSCDMFLIKNNKRK